MRKVVAIEGRPTVDHRYIMPGALEPGSERLPVSLGFRWEEIIGIATDFQRNKETGEISFEIQYDPKISERERKLLETTDGTIFVMPYESTGGEGTQNLVITKGVIKGISLSHGAGSWRDE